MHIHIPHSFHHLMSSSSSSTCPICQHTPIEPVYLLQCYHVYCRHCIQDWVKQFPKEDNPNPTCPNCRTPFLLDPSPHFKIPWCKSVKECRPNQVDVFLPVEVKCRFASCTWSGTYKTWEDHYTKECGHVPCDGVYGIGACSVTGCSIQGITRAQFPMHLKHECEMRMVSCSDCKKEFTFKDLSFHQKEMCMEKEVECMVDGCGMSYVRGQTRAHLAMECRGQRHTRCIFHESLHCKFRGTFAELELHERNLEDHKHPKKRSAEIHDLSTMEEKQRKRHKKSGYILYKESKDSSKCLWKDLPKSVQEAFRAQAAQLPIDLCDDDDENDHDE